MTEQKSDAFSSPVSSQIFVKVRNNNKIIWYNLSAMAYVEEFYDHEGHGLEIGWLDREESLIRDEAVPVIISALDKLTIRS